MTNHRFDSGCTEDKNPKVNRLYYLDRFSPLSQFDVEGRRGTLHQKENTELFMYAKDPEGPKGSAENSSQHGYSIPFCQVS